MKPTNDSSARHLFDMEETIATHLMRIDSAVYAAEVACHEAGTMTCNGKCLNRGCLARDIGSCCKIMQIREILGDHFEYQKEIIEKDGAKKE